MKSSILTFLFLIVVSTSFGASYQDERSGVEIIWPENEFFPEDIYETGSSPFALPLDTGRIESTLEVIKTALSKYPKGLLQEQLERVVLLDTMSFYGLAYAGTYWGKSVFLVNGGEELGYTLKFVEQTFHHEFSSLLFNNYQRYLNKSSWMKQTPRGFKYLENGGIEGLEKDFGYQSNASLVKQGFIVEYAQSDLEEDFNCLAENLFCCSPDFWKNRRKSRKLRRKIAMTINFYRAIDRRFKKKYFKNLCRGDSIGMI